MGNTQSKQFKNKPVAVISGDIHYSLSTLDRADKATRQAIATANELKVPFIANGDTHDTKANLRAECVNAMIETFKTAHFKPIVNIGNHCLINEKSKDHSLNFLRPYATVVDFPIWLDEIKSHVIPYQSNSETLKQLLSTYDEGSRLIIHQGCQGANIGEYVIDKTSLPAECFKEFRVIASHYHPRQDIRCGGLWTDPVGLFSYVGNPYTLGFGEAKDPEKGFQILMSDGTLEFMPTNLPKHVILEVEAWKTYDLFDASSYEGAFTKDDYVWVKLKGPESFLSKIDRADVQKALNLGPNFKFDKIPPEVVFTDAVQPSDPTSRGQTFDNLIDSIDGIEVERKERLKGTWKQLLSGDE